VYHSTLGLRVIKKKKRGECVECGVESVAERERGRERGKERGGASGECRVSAWRERRGKGPSASLTTNPHDYCWKAN